MYGEWLPFYPVPFYPRYVHRVGTKNSSVSVILSVHKLNLSLCQSLKITRAVAAIIILYAGLRIVWMTTIWGWLLLHMPAYALCSIHLRKYSSYMTLFIESRTYMYCTQVDSIIFCEEGHCLFLHVFQHVQYIYQPWRQQLPCQPSERERLWVSGQLWGSVVSSCR